MTPFGNAEALILLAGLALIILLLLLLLVRRAPSDPALGLLAAAQERQGERLGALEGNLKGEMAQGRAAFSLELTGFTREQTRFITEQLSGQRDSLGTLEKAVLDRLATDAAATQSRLTTAAEAQRQALEARLIEARDRSAQSQESLRTSVAEQLTATREALTRLEKALLERLTSDATATQTRLTTEAGQSRSLLDTKLTEMRESSDKRLAEIQKSVNEQLAEAVEKKMAESFSKVIDQFAALQRAMTDVQAVTAQIGDIKRLFGNVKTRGGWGETQVRSMLDDILPPGSYEQNVKLLEGSADAVEFCVVMPSSGETRVLLPIDSKFPTEDFERLQAAWDAADPVAEAVARRGLENAIRTQALKISQKYINPPRTTEFAVLYLPTEGLYAEVARIPGLIDKIGRDHRIVVLGPTLLPAMLRTIQLGHVTLALSKNAESVKGLLSATKSEIGKMDTLFGALAKQVGTMSNTIGKVQQRTRIISGKLRGVEMMPGEEAVALLGTEDLPDEAGDEEP